MKKRALLLCIVSISLMPLPAAAANLLIDGGFEGLSPTGTQPDGAYLGGHTNGWYVKGGNCYLYWDLTPLADGQVAHLNMGVTLQQAFATTVGTLYNVSFMATSSEATLPEKHATVWIDNGDIRGTGPAGAVTIFDTGQVGGENGWMWPANPYAFTFTAASTLTTLSVAGYSRVPVDTFVVEGSAPPPTGNLTIKKFFDCANDGVKDYVDDNLLPGWEYHITGPAGYDQTLTTDGAGQIALTGLDPGNYTITETVKQDHSITTGNQGVVIALAGGDNKTEMFGNVLPGDINQDGLVDSVDFTILKASYGLSPKTWVQGNLNPLEDALVDSVDFTILKAYYGKGVPPGPGAVPEPAALTLLVIGGLALLRRRR